MRTASTIAISPVRLAGSSSWSTNAAACGAETSFELDLNTGPELHEWRTDPAFSPSHWFVLDVAIGRARGRALTGEPPADAFPEQDDERILKALLDSLEWHADQLGEAADPGDAVLNSCRAWRWVEEHVWSSKGEAGRWAVRRPGTADAVRRALECRDGHGSAPGSSEARSFVRGVARCVAAVQNAT